MKPRLMNGCKPLIKWVARRQKWVALPCSYAQSASTLSEIAQLDNELAELWCAVQNLHSMKLPADPYERGQVIKYQREYKQKYENKRKYRDFLAAVPQLNAPAGMQFWPDSPKLISIFLARQAVQRSGCLMLATEDGKNVEDGRPILHSHLNPKPISSNINN